MDPQQCLYEALASIEDGATDTASKKLLALAGWLQKGAKPPYVAYQGDGLYHVPSKLKEAS